MGTAVAAPTPSSLRLEADATTLRIKITIGWSSGTEAPEQGLTPFLLEPKLADRLPRRWDQRTLDMKMSDAMTASRVTQVEANRLLEPA